MKMQDASGSSQKQKNPIRKPCVVGNWKMTGSRDKIAKLIENLCNHCPESLTAGRSPGSNIEIVLCPPFVYLQEVHQQLQKYEMGQYFKLGAQNVYYEPEGAFTGEISPQMLVDVGCQFVIIGHSERRQIFLEGDTLIARKFKAAYDAGLIPIVCVGETAEERAEGKTLEVVLRQLTAVLEFSPISHFSKAMIAYEPVWAIGTGQTATPEQAEAVHADIRAWVAGFDADIARQTTLLYGGSVKAANASGLFKCPDIDGALVGGASLVAEDFLKICEAASQRSL